LKEYVCFIQEEHASPLVRKLEATLEIGLHLGCCIANVATRYRKKWSFRGVGNAFSSRRLPNAY
jgi:hypothetical protein